MVGGHLVEALRRRGENALGTYVRKQRSYGTAHCDIRNLDSIADAVRHFKPHYVYLPAAETSVDLCEQQPVETAKVNVQGVENVARVLFEVGGSPSLLFFSSDYIFPDGGPSLVQTTTGPLQEYGRQKLAAEHFLALHYEHSYIIRTSWVWDAHKGFVNDLWRSTRMKVAGDQTGTPTYAPHFVDAALEYFLDRLDTDKVVHIAGKNMSRLDWATAAKKVLNIPVEIDHVVHEELPYVAKRPRNGGSASNFELPPLEVALEQVKRIYHVA